MTHAEQLSLLGLEKLNVLDKISAIIPEFQLTGSISLIEWGVCKRPVNDIDIVVSDIRLVTSDIFEQHAIAEVDYSYDYEDEIQQGKLKENKGKLPNRAHIKIYGIDVCIFFSEKEEYKICEYLSGREFKVSHPKYAIQAKKRYLKNLLEIEKIKPLSEFQINKRIKHQSDIDKYNSIYGNSSVYDFPF